MHRCLLSDVELEIQVEKHLRLAGFADLGPQFARMQQDAAAAIQELLDYRRADPTHVLSTVVPGTNSGESR